MRFGEPVEPHALTMTVVAAIGLALNVVRRRRAPPREPQRSQRARGALPRAGRCARRAARDRRRHRSSPLTHAAWIDPALSLFVAAIIVVGVVRVMRDATNVLLESVPGGRRFASDLVAHIERIGGVAGVHDLHVWSIASGSHAFGARLARRPPLERGDRASCAKSTAACTTTSASRTRRFNSNATIARSW